MSEELVWEAFPKMSRMKRECVITEKIDGTNAQILFGPDGELLAGSRKREIFPEGHEGKDKGCDNFGFAGWVYANRDALFEFLGEGRHYGEWAGGKIQRGYGLTEKQFFLFNTNRFGPDRQEIPDALKEVGLSVVPVLYIGDFTTDTVDAIMLQLKTYGSQVNQHTKFDNPEGIAVYHTALRTYFKVTFEHDGTGKGPNRQDRG